MVAGAGTPGVDQRGAAGLSDCVPSHLTRVRSFAQPPRRCVVEPPNRLGFTASQSEHIEVVLGDRLRERMSTRAVPPGPATDTSRHLRLASTVIARNYAPLPVVLAQGSGAWVADVEGRRYLDCLAAYSANNFGHCHPRLVEAAHTQMQRSTLVSRAFHNDQIGPFCEGLSKLIGKNMVLPMNTGAEAVESAIKVARKWGYERKRVPPGRATIVVANGNFHGRTTTIVGFSDDPAARDGFGPFAPGFRNVPYGRLDLLAEAIDDTTVAVLLEPIQGEAGVIIPPPGYLTGVRDWCSEHNVLLIADEVQSGLARTGTTLACDHESVEPDLVILGKSLGGGILPVSAVVGDEAVLGVLRPGEHGSTFGGNSLACAIGLAVVEMLADGTWQRRSSELGRHLSASLSRLDGNGLTAVRARGLWAGIDIDREVGTGRAVCERLLERGILAKDCHGQTIRLAPPLVIAKDEIDWLVEQLEEALSA